MSLRVSLDVFDGPLDLLLNLVKERQLDITTVPLAVVAEQYFAYIAVMEALDVEIAAEYLVIASTLVYLKSRSLLPPVPSEFTDADEESPEQVEERLRARLIAYSRYREAGEALRARALEASAYYFRDAGDPATQLVQRYRISSDRLAAALLAALREAKPERRTIARERFTIFAQMEHVVRTIRAEGRVDFVTLCRDFDRPAVVVTFLAVLELIRQRRLTFQQSGPHGELVLLPPPVVDEEQAVPLSAR